MVDSVTTAGNVNDDWEVAVDTGEFDKQLERQEKDRAAKQEPVVSMPAPTVNDNDSADASPMDAMMKSNKPIRILKRPTHQAHPSRRNDEAHLKSPTKSASTEKPDMKSPFSDLTPSSTAPGISRSSANDPTESAQAISAPLFPFTPSASQSTKLSFKTYEQRETEYRLARLRIMGEEESSAKDDDDETSTTEPTADTSTKTAPSQPSSQHPPASDSYSLNPYALPVRLPNTGMIHFTPATRLPQPHYWPMNSVPYSQMPRAPFPANYSVERSTNAWHPYPSPSSNNAQQFDHRP